MAGNKRSAPSRSSSPDVVPRKKTRIDHDVEAKPRGIQDWNAERGHEEELRDSKEYHNQATNAKEGAENKDAVTNQEAKEDDETQSKSTDVVDRLQNGGTTCGGHGTSAIVSQQGNDENAPPDHMKRQESAKKSENPRVEDGAVEDRLGTRTPDKSVDSASKIGANQRVLQELKVEIDADTENGGVLAGVPKISSDKLLEDACDPRSSNKEATSDTIITSVETVNPVPGAVSSAPAISSIKEGVKLSDKEDARQNLPSQRARSPRSPTPLVDSNIGRWLDERRSYGGRILIDKDKMRARYDARRASQSPLIIRGVPQLVFFVDGSIRRRSSRSVEQGWSDGGYRVAFRNPFYPDTIPFVSQDHNPIRFLEVKEIAELQEGIDNKYELEEGEIYDGPSRLVDFTILCYGSRKVFSVPQVELAAICQAQQIGIRYIDKHKPKACVVTIYSDATNVLKRIRAGFVQAAEGRAPLSLWYQLSNPLVQTIIWQSHYLESRGCELEIRWSPRCSALGPAIADAAAGAFKDWPVEKFSQRDLPVEVRDGMLDKLNDVTNTIIRGSSS